MSVKYKLQNGWTKKKLITFFKKNFKGRSGNVNECLYRSELNGEENKCHIGHFIPDELYRRKFEGKTIRYVLEEQPKLKEYMPLDFEGLEALQYCHDEGMEKNILDKTINMIKNHCVD